VTLSTSYEVALANLTLLGTPPPLLVEAAAAGGFDSLTVRVVPAVAGEKAQPMLGDTPMVRETLVRLSDLGLSVLDIEVIRLKPDLGTGDIEPILEAGARLGARHVIVVSDDPDRQRTAAAFSALCDQAVPFGIRPVLEFMVFTAVRTLDDAFAIVRGSPPSGGILVDALHLERSGGDPPAVKGLAASAPERFPYLQICDFAMSVPHDDLALRTEAREDRLLPGEGAAPLGALLDALPAVRTLSVEVPVARLRGAEPTHVARSAAQATERLLARCRAPGRDGPGQGEPVADD